MEEERIESNQIFLDEKTAIEQAEKKKCIVAYY